MTSPLRFLCMVAALVLSAAVTPAAGMTSDDLFDPSTLHEVRILINARDWADLRASFAENTYYPCDFEWRGIRARNAGCRSRGGGTRNGVKPGLRIDFNHYVTGQQFLGLDALVLDNFWQDPSLLRERLSMHLLARLGLPVPRESYARVYVGSGQDYAGIYGLVEEIDDEFLRRQFGSSGFLFEYRWIDEYRFEWLGPELEPYALRFEPRTHERDSMFTLYGPIRDLITAINEADTDDLETLLAPHIDLAAVITQLAAENYLAEWDGLAGYAGVNNFYLYRSAASGMAQLLAWDKDSTFAWADMPPDHNLADNVLTRKIWSNRALRHRYLSELSRAASMAASLDTEALEAYELIRDAALEDRLKPFSNEQFIQAVDDVRQFARDRGAFVRRAVQSLESVAGAGAGVAAAR